MTICLGKSCPFGLLCVSFVNVYQFLCVSFFSFGFEGGMWDLIVLISDHCLSIYSAFKSRSKYVLKASTVYMQNFRK